MKYIKLLSGGSVFQKEEITKQDLIDIKDGFADCLVDIENSTYFDKDTNTWKPLPQS